MLKLASGVILTTAASALETVSNQDIEGFLAAQFIDVEPSNVPEPTELLSTCQYYENGSYYNLYGLNTNNYWESTDSAGSTAYWSFCQPLSASTLTECPTLVAEGYFAVLKASDGTCTALSTTQQDSVTSIDQPASDN